MSQHKKRTAPPSNPVEAQGSEEGQSLIELTIAAPFLIMLVLAMMEVGFVFAAYISLVNGVREATSFASKFPQLTDSTYYNAGYQGCDTSSSGCQKNQEVYIGRVSAEVYNPGELLRGEGIIRSNSNNLYVYQPTAPSGITPGSPITVTAVYSIETFMSTMSLPYFGRFGLPQVYVLRYSMSMPVR